MSLNPGWVKLRVQRTFFKVALGKKIHFHLDLQNGDVDMRRAKQYVVSLEA